MLYNLASGVDIRKKDQKDLRIKLVESCLKQDDHKRETLKHKNKPDQNPPITNPKP